MRYPLSSLLIFLFSAFVCLATANAAKETPRAAMVKIAEATGIESFDQVRSLSYTFQARLGQKSVRREWTWRPQSDTVILHKRSDVGAVSYQRGQVEADESLAEVDQQFVNDAYWLLFPFQVVWDDSVTIEALPARAAEVFPEAEAGLRVRYPDGVGYTPGDVYDLFYDDNYRVTHWVFRKGGSATPTRSNYWVDYENFGGIDISLNRPSPDESFRIWFEDVSIDLD
ncbi:MAG: hypothetical protein GVY36_04705 [Verrucomicrobia bacterium]|jgi:hypothetical protein|nr:hypothetical protein [Verrucomicrobiota bacterium]